MVYWIILAIFLVPMASIVSIPGTIVWYPQLLALQFIGCICLASRFWSLNKSLAVFLAYLAFSYIYVTSANPRTLLCLMIGYAAITVTLVVSTIKDLKWIYRALIVMSLLDIGFVILQACGIDPIFIPIIPGKHDIVGFMGSHNQMGISAACNAFWSPYLIPLALVPIFLVKCNSALIGLIVGTIVYIGYTLGKKYVLSALVLIALLAVPWWHYCHKSHQELGERVNLWKLSIDQIISGKIESCDLTGHRTNYHTNPFFGFGLGNFFTLSPLSQYKMYGFEDTQTYVSGNPQGKILHFYEHAHNDLIEAIFEFGYIGFIILLLMIDSVITLFIKAPKTHGVILTFAALIAQSVASFSVYVFHAPVSLFMICLTLGLFYAEVNHAKTSR